MMMLEPKIPRRLRGPVIAIATPIAGALTIVVLLTTGSMTTGHWPRPITWRSRAGELWPDQCEVTAASQVFSRPESDAPT